MVGRLLDPDVLIDALRGHSPAVLFLSELEGETLLVSSLSKAELFVGAKTKKDLANIEIFVAQFGELRPDALIAEKALQILRKHHLKDGTGIIDSFIAATAIEYDIPLYSKNVKHFAPVEELYFRKPY